jgi:hypothetical protein
MFEFSRKVEPLDLAIEAPTQPGPFVFRVKAVSGDQRLAGILESRAWAIEDRTSRI